MYFSFFFFNDTATTEIYTLSLHDALPISTRCSSTTCASRTSRASAWRPRFSRPTTGKRSARRCARSEEHTSELQSLAYLVCRLLLEKKKTRRTQKTLRRASAKKPLKVQPP